MVNNIQKIVLVIVLVAFSNKTKAQSLEDILEQQTPKTKDYVSATFKATRILNGHSIESRKKGVTEFVISHRFGRVNLGIDELFGLDQSNIRFALERSFTDNLMLGFGRSSYEKTYDSFFKYKLLKQRQEKNIMPISASVFGSVAYKTVNETDLTFNQSLIYVTQLLVARKFSPSFSLQLMPSYIYRNSARTNDDPHGIFAVGFGSRIKFTKTIALNTEYHYTVNPIKSTNPTNSIALGIEIETGGHVFQISLSNSITMIEKSFITESTDNFFQGDIHLGFNISRAFEGKK